MEFSFKKYSAYKDSGAAWLGEIPDHWELTRLGTKFEERRTKVSDKDYPPLSVTKQGILPQLDQAAKTNDGDNRKLVKAGDFVINSRSDRKGSSGVANIDGSVSLINIAMEPKDVNPMFCNYLLKSNSFIEEFYRMGHGIVADLWTTRFDEMKAIIIGIPPKPEQTAIANFLNRKIALIDKAIAIKEKQIALLKERNQILIHNAVTRGLNPHVKLKRSGVEWIGNIPDNWEVKRLASFGAFSKGAGIPRDELTDEGVPAILYGDIYTKYEIVVNNVYHKISTKTAKGARKIAKNALLFTGSGETAEDIGKCVVYQGDDAVYVGGDVIIFEQIENDSLFLCYVLNTNGVKVQKAKHSKGEIIVHTYASKLKEIRVPIPPKSEQTAIASHIDTTTTKTNAAISLKEKEIEKLKEYKTVLIDSAVTGKIKVEELCPA
ncbi:restriction endonuclease subunit S [Anseongella ginsenosidimutans]|nr:restriction endonuclease subunit S [Anseongella ginsenosidimutans]